MNESSGKYYPGRKLVHIASSRYIGDTCKRWASENTPEGFGFTEDPNECDVFISVMYDKLVSEDFIDNRRCYNFHPGILPQYRGSGAFSWCIINGEKECGITLHELDVNIDTGPIIDVNKFSIQSTDTAETLFNKGMDALFKMFQQWFQLILNPDNATKPFSGSFNMYRPQPQDESKAHTYYRKHLTQQMDLTRFVRAFTFEGKDPAFYIDRDGNKVEMRW